MAWARASNGTVPRIVEVKSVQAVLKAFCCAAVNPSARRTMLNPQLRAADP